MHTVINERGVEMFGSHKKSLGSVCEHAWLQCCVNEWSDVGLRRWFAPFPAALWYFWRSRCDFPHGIPQQNRWSIRLKCYVNEAEVKRWGDGTVKVGYIISVDTVFMPSINGWFRSFRSRWISSLFWAFGLFVDYASIQPQVGNCPSRRPDWHCVARPVLLVHMGEPFSG